MPPRVSDLQAEPEGEQALDRPGHLDDLLIDSKAYLDLK
jgi:hypothetical protein